MTEETSFLKDIILGGTERLMEINNKEKIELFPLPEDDFKKASFSSRLSKEDFYFLSYFISFMKNYTRCFRGNPYLPADQTKPEFNAEEVFHFFKNEEMIENFSDEYYDFLRSYLKVTESADLNLIKGELLRCVPFVQGKFVTISHRNTSEDFPPENFKALVDFYYENYSKLLRKDFPEPAKPVLIFLPLTSLLNSNQIESFNKVIQGATPLLELKGTGNDEEFVEIINEDNIAPLSNDSKDILLKYKDFLILKIKEREEKAKQRQAEREANAKKETQIDNRPKDGPKSAENLLAEFEKDLDKK